MHLDLRTELMYTIHVTLRNAPTHFETNSCSFLANYELVFNLMSELRPIEGPFGNAWSRKRGEYTLHSPRDDEVKMQATASGQSVTDLNIPVCSAPFKCSGILVDWGELGHAGPAPRPSSLIFHKHVTPTTTIA